MGPGDRRAIKILWNKVPPRYNPRPSFMRTHGRMLNFREVLGAETRREGNTFRQTHCRFTLSGRELCSSVSLACASRRSLRPDAQQSTWVAVRVFSCRLSAPLARSSFFLPNVPAAYSGSARVSPAFGVSVWFFLVLASISLPGFGPGG